MNSVWNLDPIYRGFDDPAFEADLKKLEKTVADFAGQMDCLASAEPLEGLRQGIASQEQIYELMSKLSLYASLRQSVNTGDAEAGSALGRTMAAYSAAAAPMAAFRSWAAGLENLQELISRDEVLSAYRFYFQKLAQSSRYLLPKEAEAVEARMSLSGGDAWSELHQYLTSTVEVNYRGETVNLSTVRNLAHDPDPMVRRDAYEAELKCYPAIAAPAAYALNSIKLETISDCLLRGYDSPLERTLWESDMQKQTLDAMLDAIREYLPHFHRYLKTKAKALGHENGLPWYDLFAPMGRCNTVFTTQQVRDYLVSLFETFDSEVAQLVATAFDEAWIDFYPHSGKTGGAFCAGVDCLKESRILTNFDGRLRDVVTLAHELGHAFHDHCILGNRPLNRSYSMPLAETASTFNECVVMSAAICGAADDAERLNLVESQLRDTTQIICDILSRYLFETAVFANRAQHFMDADTLCGMMLDAQKQAYGDGLDGQYLHPYMWVCKSHYYGPTFYNFPYAFGGLFARGLYARYLQEGEAFLPKYKQLLRTTCVASAEDTAKVAGIDLTDRNFWRSALQTVADQIDQFCSLVEK